jgi:4-amino-4-deoxy-L-arabinose transferase-like glycosyltransferase
MEVREPPGPTVDVQTNRSATVVGRAVEQRRARRRELWTLAAVLLALTVLLRLPAFFVDVFNSDETFLATQAQVIREGGDLYREAADRKPPLVPYVYAAVFAVTGTTELWSVRVAAMLAVVVTALLLAFEARRRAGPRAMWIAGLLTVVALVAFAPQDGQAANFEIFMLPAMVAAVVLARRGHGTTAGVAAAFATLAKQTGAAVLLPVVYLLWKRRGRNGIADAAVGFLIPILLVAMWFGPRQIAYWTVLGNGSYVGLDTASALVIAMFVLMTIGWAACNVPILWTLPRSWRARRELADDGTTNSDLWLWLLSGAVSVAIGLRFFGHYYLQLVPPLVLLAAIALSRASKRAVHVTIAFALVSGVMFSAAGYFLKPFGPEPQYQSVARYIETHSSIDDRVLVWGNVPEIYWASDRLPATRYLTTTGFLGGYQPGRSEAERTADLDEKMWKWFYRDLEAHPPRYIVDAAPAQVRDAERSPIREFPRLRRYVNRQYDLIRTIDGFHLYERT